MTVKAVKYLYKYIYKGFDGANIQINERLDHDEVTTFLDARYVSSPEACWRLFAYNLHDQSHFVKVMKQLQLSELKITFLISLLGFYLISKMQMQICTYTLTFHTILCLINHKKIGR